MRVKRLSVVVPTFNRFDSLRRVLDGLAKQTLPASEFEVVVVSDGSTDGTLAMLDEHASTFELRAFSQQNAGPSAARNYAVSKARGELIVFIDDDLVPGPRCLAEHLAFHDSAEGPCAALGPMLGPPDFVLQPWARWEQKVLDRSYAEFPPGIAPASPRQFFTANASVRRDHFDAVSGFDPSLRRDEDVELAYRLDGIGLKFFFLPEAFGYHFARRDYESWASNASSYGTTDVDFHRSRGQDWLLADIASEWHKRHLLVRSASWLGAGRPRVASAMESVLSTLATRDTVFGSQRIVNAALSGVYNLRYYCALADALGGRRVFLDLLRSDAVSDDTVSNDAAADEVIRG